MFKINFEYILVDFRANATIIVRINSLEIYCYIILK
jgi:hypothetical protein